MANNTLSITYKFKGDTGGLKDMVKEVEKMQQAFRDGVQPAEQLRTSLINFNQLSQSFEAIGQSVSALSSVMQDLSSAYAVQVEAETKLETVMRQRMGATTEQIQSIKDYASALQEIGVVGDEVQLAGAQQLATFLSTSSALKELMPAMANLAVQQHGLSVSQSDMVGIANLFGKAMMGQTAALRKVGITMTEQEEQLVKNGTEMQRAAALAQIITNNVGEMNTAMAATDAGKARQLSNAMGDLKEKLGAVVSQYSPYVSLVSAIIASTANFGRAAAAMRGLAAACFGANGALKFVSTSSVAAAFGMNAAGVGARFLAAGLRAVLAATGVGLALAGISAAVEYFTSATDKATDSAKGFAGATGDMGDAQMKAQMSADQEREAMEQLRAQLVKDIAATKNFTGTKAEEQKVVEELNDRYGATIGYFTSVSDWYKALVADSEAYCQQMILEARIRKLANQIADEQEFQWGLTHNPDGTLKQPMPSNVGGFDIPNTANAVNNVVNAQLSASKQREKGLLSQVDSLTKQVVPMPVKGSPSRPAPKGGSGGGHSGGSGTPPPERELNALEKIEEQIKQNEIAALTANEEELAILQEKTRELVIERDRLRAIQASLTEIKPPEYTPPAIEEIKTYEELEKALNYYQEALKKAEPESRAEINATIKTLEKLREGWDEALNPKAKENPLDGFIKQIADGSKSQFKSQQSPLASMDFKSLRDEWQTTMNLLYGMDGDITEEQRKSLQLAAAEYAKYAKKASVSYDNIKGAWGNAKSVVNGVNSIKEAVEGNGSAWERISSGVDAALQVYEGISGIVELIKMLTGVTQMQSAASTANAAAEQSAAQQKVQASSMVTTANIAEGASGMFKAYSWMPWVGLAMAAVGIGTMIATMSSLPKYAKGGIAYGPTVGMFGEYAGASNNPEVVAPLDRLQSILDYGGGSGGVLTCKVKTSDLEFVLDRRKRKQSRT